EFILERVADFNYLGSTLSNFVSVGVVVNRRIAKAAAVMARLNRRVWKTPSLNMKITLRVYQACVIITLLYGSETWTTYASQERKLNSFQLRCLRRILQIPRRDNIPNTEVLGRSQMTSMYAILTERRLRWLGNVVAYLRTSYMAK
uniref:hypothetical protein n=1 Tax=Acinetobacter baumannii TaxID=470 RepID=UPI0033949111